MKIETERKRMWQQGRSHRHHGLAKQWDKKTLYFSDYDDGYENLPFRVTRRKRSIYRRIVEFFSPRRPIKQTRRHI